MRKMLFFVSAGMNFLKELTTPRLLARVVEKSVFNLNPMIDWFKISHPGQSEANWTFSCGQRRQAL